jgi:hypothetical protein
MYTKYLLNNIPKWGMTKVKELFVICWPKKMSDTSQKLSGVNECNTTFGHFETTPSSDSGHHSMVPEEHCTKENLHSQGSMFQELWENLSAVHCQKSDYQQHSLPIHWEYNKTEQKSGTQQTDL